MGFPLDADPIAIFARRAGQGVADATVGAVNSSGKLQ
jgi:hypothetical protein